MADNQLVELKRRRTVVRREATINMKIIETELKKEMTTDSLEESLELLQEIAIELESLDNEIEKIIDLEELEADMISSMEHREKVIIWRFRARKKINTQLKAKETRRKLEVANLISTVYKTKFTEDSVLVAAERESRIEEERKLDKNERRNADEEEVRREQEKWLVEEQMGHDQEEHEKGLKSEEQRHMIKELKSSALKKTRYQMEESQLLRAVEYNRISEEERLLKAAEERRVIEDQLRKKEDEQKQMLEEKQRKDDEELERSEEEENILNKEESRLPHASEKVLPRKGERAKFFGIDTATGMQPTSLGEVKTFVRNTSSVSLVAVDEDDAYGEEEEVLVKSKEAKSRRRKKKKKKKSKLYREDLAIHGRSRKAAESERGELLEKTTYSSSLISPMISEKKEDLSVLSKVSDTGKSVYKDHHDDLIPGQTYRYQLRAMNAAGPLEPNDLTKAIPVRMDVSAALDVKNFNELLPISLWMIKDTPATEMLDFQYKNVPGYSKSKCKDAKLKDNEIYKSSLLLTAWWEKRRKDPGRKP